MKKAETNLLWVIIGIVVAIFILFPLFNITKAFFAKQDNTLENFNNLINKINALNANEETQTLFVFDSDYFLVGFKKDESFIENKDCGDFIINGRLNKPEACSNNACLCLCRGKSISPNLCANENDRCMPFENLNIIDNQNVCNYFVLNKDSNLIIKKQQDNIIINKERYNTK